MSIALAPGAEPISGFRCVRRLGRSPLAETWLVQTEDESYRVLKLIYHGSALRNAKKLTHFRHPFLLNWERAEVHDTDLVLITDWVEETVEAEFLEAQQNGQPGIPRATLLRYMEELAEVLDYLHVKHRLVHGRFKLSQIGIQHRHVKLLDWGLIHAEHLSGQNWSISSLLTTAPEVLHGHLEPASDQFSLAAFYVHASTGQPLLTVQSLPEFFKIRKEQTFNPQLVSEVELTVFQRAFHADHASRFPTCASFVKALQLVHEAAGVETRADTQAVPQTGQELHALNMEEPIWQPPPVASSADVAGNVPTVILKSLVAIEPSGNSRHPDSAFLNLNNLAYQAKVQSVGILTPTLIVGLGRAGTGVLQELSRLIHQRFDGLSNLPHLRLLAVDELVNDDPSTTILKPGSLQKDHFLHCPLPASDQVRILASNVSVAAWFPEELLEHAQPQASALGRLSLVSRFGELQKRFKEECRLMLQSESLMQAKQLTGLSIRQDLTPTFYVIGSLDEGFSSGTVADVASMLRTVIAETGWGEGQVCGLFFLPNDDQPEAIKAQGYATLVELNHYTQEQQFTARYDATQEITSPHQPFNRAFFRKLSSPDELAPEQPAFRSTAHWLMREVTSELGSLRQASRETTRPFGSQTTPWFSHGLTTLNSSHEALKEALKNQLRGKLISYWLNPDHGLDQTISSEGERFLGQNVYSASALLNRYQHLVALVLGREPATVIDEWVAPLRKGAAARPPLEALARDIMEKVEYTFGAGTGYLNSPAMVAIQQEAESLANEIGSRISPFILQYLDKPGFRLGAALHLCKLFLDWVNHHLTELQASHLEIHQDMLRAERTITQMMSQEERSFAIMGRQRLVSQIAQDLMDYPSRVLKEDMFARAVHVFQHIKKTIEECAKKLHPAEFTLRELQKHYLSPASTQEQLLLDGERSLPERVDHLIQLLPADVYLRLDSDLTEAMLRFQSNFVSVCLGTGPSFTDILDLLDNSLEETLEGLLPSEDAAEQLLSLPSQAVVEQLRESYRDARPDLMENKRSRQGAFCLMLTPASESGQELLQMAQATLPQIVAANEGQSCEILMYRETGCLLPHEIYPQGREAYETRCQDRTTSPHSRFDIKFWHTLATPNPGTTLTPASSFDLST
ncbi:MAG TPA: tubulin-like doman-containing protein [Gemmatales bacterium]|nr:tubulin-like doman-containing protein [Gemmatales bacterium]